MRTTLGVVAGVIIGAAAWAGAAQQTQPPLPGPGTGTVTVAGEVKIANRPTVDAAQAGDWKVAVAGTTPVIVSNTASVTIATPFTLRKGGRYEVVWSGGERETVTITETNISGWVIADSSGQAGGRRWLNLAQLRSISEPR